MRLIASLLSVFGWLMIAAVSIVRAQSATSYPETRAASQIDFPRTDSTEMTNFRKYLSDDWKQWMADYPEMATHVGFPGHDTRWTDESSAGIARRQKHLRDSLAELRKFDRARLPTGEQLNYDLYKELLETAEEGLKYFDDAQPFRSVVPHNLMMPINQIEGVQQGAASTIAVMPHTILPDFENIVARLEKLPALVEQNIALLEQGLKMGMAPSRITLRDLPKQIDGLITGEPLQSPLLRPFADMPASLPPAERERLTKRAAHTYTHLLVPVFRRLRDYLAQKYIPAARESIAASALPNGAAAYPYRVRWHTTTNLTPQQIHEIGLGEVKRIRAEMDKVIASTGFKGGFTDFTNFLRTDPRFYFDKPEDLVNAYRVIAKLADPELVHLFGKLPRLTYGVVEIPAFKATSQTTAYYEQGSPEAGRPGHYFVNTYNLKARPKWEMEALSLHESVPGHHVQISLAQEMEGLPEFRRHIGYSAFVEGWALYSESLGSEMGFYTDPYSKFGQLTYEMWRAVRLVVDTGMHAMGWSREQAIEFFRENAAKTDQDIIVEVDRYIVWPGQALAYKIGQLKIRELRTKAERELGSRFKIRAFHDAVLEQGAVPLGALEGRVNAWIEQQKVQ